MPKGVYKLPNITNEPIKSYAPGSPERADLKAKIEEIKNKVVDLPMIIDGKEVRTQKLADIRPPHDHQHLLGHYHQGDASHVQMAIEAAMKAKPAWEKMNWESRAAIFLKAAELIAGPYRQVLNAVTMLGQSKNAFQAEIDCVCELADFYRFNVKNMYELYHMQPNSSPGISGPDRMASAGRICFCTDSVQLHFHCRKSSGSPGINGKCMCMETF